MKRASTLCFAALLGCSAPTPLRDSLGDESLDAGVTSPQSFVPTCPQYLPGTDNGVDAPGDPGFGCYGACGPSCKSVCVESDAELALVGTDDQGQPTCTVCRYRVKTCKSHPFCRWHDDCYRQCDISWLKHRPTEPIPSPPDNLCYLSCDRSGIGSCGADWTDLPVVGSPGSISPSCWDGSVVRFSVGTGQERLATACTQPEPKLPCPWAATDAKWPADGAPPPATLPKNARCWYDANCPDPNTSCEGASPIFPGRCTDLPAATPPSPAYVPPSAARCF